MAQQHMQCGAEQSIHLTGHEQVAVAQTTTRARFELWEKHIQAGEQGMWLSGGGGGVVV